MCVRVAWVCVPSPVRACWGNGAPLWAGPGTAWERVQPACVSVVESLPVCVLHLVAVQLWCGCACWLSFDGNFEFMVLPQFSLACVRWGCLDVVCVVIGVEPETAVISAVLFVLYLAGLKLSYELRSYGCYLDAIRI